MEPILLGIPAWLLLTVYGFSLTAMMGFGAIVLLRVGHSPLWVLLLLVPFLQPIAIWIFAYMRWPRIEDPEGWEERRLAVPPRVTDRQA